MSQFSDKENKMNQVIIYKQDNSTVAVIIPTPEALQTHTIEEIALKDVPAGKPFKIASLKDLPLDGTFNEIGLPNIDKTWRAAWDIDDEELSDGVGSVYNTFEEIIND
jgi:hypothetical protein